MDWNLGLKGPSVPCCSQSADTSCVYTELQRRSKENALLINSTALIANWQTFACKGGNLEWEVHIVVKGTSFVVAFSKRRRLSRHRCSRRFARV